MLRSAAAQPLSAVRFAGGSVSRAGVNCALLAAWLLLYRPVLEYMATIFTRPDFAANRWALLGVLALLCWRLHRARLRPRLDSLPQLSLIPVALALGGSLAYLAAEWYLDVNTFSATLFGLATYGLAGLWLRPGEWRRGLPAALLAIGVLPFGEHLQSFLGYPLRIMTAAVVRDGLSAAGFTSVGIDTILVLENGASQVDVPCSGVKSLWAGCLFLLAATWLERRQVGARWGLTAGFLCGLLLLANTLRVGALVVAGQVIGGDAGLLVARMLHLPLGLLGFAASCAVALSVLRRFVPPTAPDNTPAQSYPRPVWLAPALLMLTVAFVLAYAPRPHAPLAQAATAWRLPPGLAATPLPLEPDQLTWLSRDGADSADRWRFTWKGHTGSLMLVSSSTWRAQHLPERCFEVYGLSLDGSVVRLVAPDAPVRLVSLGSRERGASLSAMYWFQSPTRTTDDYATRIWADVLPDRERWVLVTMLIDDASVTTDELDSLAVSMHAAVQQNLTGGFE